MRSAIYEQELTKQGVQFTYVEKVMLEDVDAGKGLRNQARLVVPLDEKLVEQYATAYAAGAEFPPFVLNKPGRGRLIPIDANHRIAACQRPNVNKKWHDAYVVETADQMVVDRLTWTFNLLNGKRPDEEDCLQHAVSLVLKWNYSTKQAAEECKVPNWLVQRTVRVNRTRDKLQSLGVKLTKALTDDLLDRLSVLESIGEDLLAMVANVVAKSGVSKDTCQELVKDVKAARTHEAKMKVVEAFANSSLVKRKEAETKGGSVKAPRPRVCDQFAKLLNQMSRMFETYKEKGALRRPSPEFKDDRDTARFIVGKLTELYGLGVVLPQEEVG